MSKILEGDFVKFKAKREDGSPNFVKTLEGKEGRVIINRDHDILVLWDGWDDGHDGYMPEPFYKKHNIQEGSCSCWYVVEYEVELIGGIVENE